MMNENKKLLKVFAAISGAFAVMLGAFAAHALKGNLSPYQQGIWKTAVFYQFVHTLLLILVSQMRINTKWIGRLLMSGIVLFSGSLYLLAVTSVKSFGVLTPIGGLCFIFAWLLLALQCIKQD